MEENEVALGEIFDALAQMSLEVTPFRGAAIAVVDENNRFRGCGGAGIFDGGAVRRSLAYSRDEHGGKQKPKLLSIATSRLENEVEPQTNTSVGTLEEIEGIKAFRIDNVLAAETSGVFRIMKEIYIEGECVKELFAFPLCDMQMGSFGRLIGLLVLNNIRSLSDLQEWLANEEHKLEFNLLLQNISMVATEYTKGNKGLLDVLPEVLPRNAVRFLTAMTEATETQITRAHKKLSMVYSAMSVTSSLFGFLSGLSVCSLVGGVPFFGLSRPIILATAVLSGGLCIETLLAGTWLQKRGGFSFSEAKVR